VTITLFRPFRDPYRRSMQVYGDALHRALEAIADGRYTVRDLELPGARTTPGWARYWDQYVAYQRLARRAAGDVNHIVDHGYAHLGYALPPERTVVTFHDAVVIKAPGASWRTKLSLRYSLGAMRRVARVIAVSKVSRDDLLQLVDYPAERVAVVYEGVGEEFRPPDDRAATRHALGLARPTVLHVGHTQPYMNLPRILGAVAALVREGIDAELVRVGGRLTPAQRACAEALGLAGRVRELGFVPTDRLAAVYGAADVLLYAPLYAGFGLPPLEAMACGTPVVCSDRGALPEVAGDAALLVDPTDERALASAVARLLTETALRDAQVARGLEHAARFTWEATARGVVRVYEEMVRG
jgi:glycosyltransferase involved in cell wall biosynthesis